VNEDFTWRKGYVFEKWPAWFLYLTKYPQMPSVSCVWCFVAGKWALASEFVPLVDVWTGTAAEARRRDEERLGLEPCLVEET
jgi:hypothetical protein